MMITATSGAEEAGVMRAAAACGRRAPHALLVVVVVMVVGLGPGLGGGEAAAVPGRDAPTPLADASLAWSSDLDPDASTSDHSPTPHLAPSHRHGRGTAGSMGSGRRASRPAEAAVGPYVDPATSALVAPVAPVGPPIDAPGAPTASTPSRLPSLPTDSVVGFDTRSQVFDTTGSVPRMVALITLHGNHFCTGFLIGPDTLATAGHCLHTGGVGGTWYPAAALRVYPGYSSASPATAPYGSCGARGLYAPAGWTVGGAGEHDYGAIKLDCTVGHRTGWFGWWWQPKSLDGQPAKVMGYPGDKGQQQWKAKDYVRVTEPRRVFYAADTTGGNSGSPVFRIRGATELGCQGPCVMAVHGYGLAGPWPHGAYNHGARVTQEMSDNFFLWRGL